MADERSLTRGEISICRMIFRDTIPTAMVRIVRRKVGFGGFTPFEKINVDEGHYKPDYVSGDLPRPSEQMDVKKLHAAEHAHWFVHELTHVWQHFVGMPKAPMFFKSRREGRALLWRRKRKLVLDSYDGEAALYDYRIDRSGLDLLDFNLEQQAEIIADYFAWTLWKLEPNFLWDDWPKPTVEQLIAVLSRFNQDPSYPRRETRGDARRADRRAWTEPSRAAQRTRHGPADRSHDPKEASMLFPIAKGEKYGSNWKTAGVRGGFRADRKGRPHAGCDIGAKDGVRVVAIDAGKVVERGDKPFIRDTNLFAIAVKHTSGIVARYTEINEIPAHLTKGAEVKAGETLGRVAFQGKGSMLHFELYRGDRSGTLSVPWAIWPRIGSARKKPEQLTPAEKSRVRTAGYLWDFMRRDDLVDPTEFLIKLEKGETIVDKSAALIAIGLGIVANPVAGIAQAVAYATGDSGMPLTAAESIEDATTLRAYEGVTGVAFEGSTVMTTQPVRGHPRDYWGPTDVAMPEPD